MKFCLYTAVALDGQGRVDPARCLFVALQKNESQETHHSGPHSVLQAPIPRTLTFATMCCNWTRSTSSACSRAARAISVRCLEELRQTTNERGGVVAECNHGFAPTTPRTFLRQPQKRASSVKKKSHRTGCPGARCLSGQ